jgi:ABC-type sulfate/molybdate transport systems ATPase subunit
MRTSVKLRGIRNGILMGVDLKIMPGELLVLVGPSGAGKTTLLNVIAGLAGYLGKVWFDGHCMDHLPPHRRGVGYCFQELFLFPHLTVKKNVLLAMKGLPMDRREKEGRAETLLTLFKIAHLGSRLPETLSGGEKQRAALARTVATQPRVLLLDEPFANLDFRTSRYLRQEFKRFQKRLGLTTLFVTHNLQEARELGDRIAVLRAGRLEKPRGPEDSWMEQARKSQFLETPNLLPCGGQKRVHPGLVQVQWAGFSLLVPDDGRPFTHLTILPHEVYISPLPPPGPPINRFLGRTCEIHPDEEGVSVTVAVGGEEIRSEISHDNLSAMGLKVGDPVYGILKLRALRGCNIEEGNGRTSGEQ